MFRHDRSHRITKRGQIVEALPIHDRPKEVEGREITRYWEGDLLVGTTTGSIATVVERKSRLTLLCMLSDKK